MKYVRQLNGQIRATEDFTLHDGRVIERGTLGGWVESSRNLAQSGKCWVFPGAKIKDDAYVSGNALVGGIYVSAVIKTALGAISDPDTLLAIDAILGERLSLNLSTLLTDSQAFSDFLNDPSALGKIFNILEKVDAGIISSSVDPPSVISDSAKIYGNAVIHGSTVTGEARVLGDAVIKNGSEIGDEAHIIGKVLLTNEGKVFGKARVQGEAIIDGGIIKDNAVIMGKPLIFGMVEGEGRVSDCVSMDKDSIVRGNVSGCVQLTRTVLEPNSIVTGDHELEDEIVEDPSLATSCPERVPQLNEECCTPREVYLCVARLQEGETVTVRTTMQEALEQMLHAKELTFLVSPSLEGPEWVQYTLV